MAKRPFPVVWILHEWWDEDMIQKQLEMRNNKGMTATTVKKALSVASHIVFVCEAQRVLYGPTAPSSVIYVGVPAPAAEDIPDRAAFGIDEQIFTFLNLGIVCPRKNQVWAVQLFKEFAGDRQNLRLKVVGARYTRQYEIDYLNEVKRAIDGDSRIELLDVTSQVDQFYKSCDCLLFTSTNEVTPMVISEAMSYGLPIISTDIAGIPEMITHGVEGYLCKAGETEKAVNYMQILCDDKERALEMGEAGKRRFSATFDLNKMVADYRQLLFNVAPPVILIDMDNSLVDWDAGFKKHWAGRCSIDREKSFFMANCVEPEFFNDVSLVDHAQGFFLNLPPMEGGIDAVHEMASMGLNVFIVTSAIMTSPFSAQEKIEWVRKYFGNLLLNKMIMLEDKTKAKGDILIDDKPLDELAPGGKHTSATWKQVVFDQPYNRNTNIPRITHWNEWKEIILPLLGSTDAGDPNPYEFEYGTPIDELTDFGRTARSGSTDAYDMRMQLLAQSAAVPIGGPLGFRRSEMFLDRLGTDGLRNDTDVDNNRKERTRTNLETAEKLLLALTGDTDELQLFRESYSKWKQGGTKRPGENNNVS